MTPHDEEAYGPLHPNDHDGHDAPGPEGYGGYDNGYGNSSLNPYGPDSLGHHEPNPFDDHSEYRPQTSTGTTYAPPSAQDEYEEEGRPAQFPVAPYDRGA